MNLTQFLSACVCARQRNREQPLPSIKVASHINRALGVYMRMYAYRVACHADIIIGKINVFEIKTGKLPFRVKQ